MLWARILTLILFLKHLKSLTFRDIFFKIFPSWSVSQTCSFKVRFTAFWMRRTWFKSSFSPFLTKLSTLSCFSPFFWACKISKLSHLNCRKYVAAFAFFCRILFLKPKNKIPCCWSPKRQDELTEGRASKWRRTNENLAEKTTTTIVNKVIELKVHKNFHKTPNCSKISRCNQACFDNTVSPGVQVQCC